MGHSTCITSTLPASFKRKSIKRENALQSTTSPITKLVKKTQAMRPHRPRSKLDRPGNILLALQYRDRLSLGENRVRLGFAAFHWSIIIRFTSFHRFDVTDGIVQDEVGNDINPNRDWMYRHQINGTLIEIPRYLGAVRIGESSPRTKAEDIDALFKSIALPAKDAVPAQNCVSWARDAVGALQAAGCVSNMDIDSLMGFALHHADERIKNPTSLPEIVSFPDDESKSMIDSLMKRIRGLRHQK